MWLAEAFDLAHKALIYLRLRYSLFFECKRYPIFAIGYYYQKMFACQEIWVVHNFLNNFKSTSFASNSKYGVSTQYRAHRLIGS